MRCSRSGTATARPSMASSIPTRACPRWACACPARRICRRSRSAELGAALRRCRRLRSAPHRARRAARRARFHLWRRLPARRRSRPARRRRFRERLLHRPGSGVARRASRHRARPHRAGGASTACAPSRHAGNGRRQDRRHHGLIGRRARACDAAPRSRRGCDCGGTPLTRRRHSVASARSRLRRLHFPDGKGAPDESDQACGRAASLPLAEGRSALRRLSRRRMGRAGI